MYLDTPTGEVALNAPAPVMPGGTIGPPPGLDPAAANPTSPSARSGRYSGTATPVMSGGGNCISSVHVVDFDVQGNNVRFGEFHGTIDPNGRLEMVFGRTWIIGQFDGADFFGQMNISGGFNRPGCSYAFRLQRAGA